MKTNIIFYVIKSNNKVYIGYRTNIDNISNDYRSISKIARSHNFYTYDTQVLCSFKSDIINYNSLNALKYLFISVYENLNDCKIVNQQTIYKYKKFDWDILEKSYIKDLKDYVYSNAKYTNKDIVCYVYDRIKAINIPKSELYDEVMSNYENVINENYEKISNMIKSISSFTNYLIIDNNDILKDTIKKLKDSNFRVFESHNMYKITWEKL